MKLSTCCAVVISFLAFVISAAAQTSPSNTETTSASVATVQVPRLIRFSGIAKDETGKPMSGILGITFALYQDEQGGAPLWLETQNVQADGSGHYAVLLGSATVDGVPLSLFSSAEVHWIGAQISGHPEQPRVLLLSVPYALKAADAETLGGLPAAAFVHTGSGEALGSMTTRPKAHASSNSAGNAAAPPATITGSGTTNFIPLWTSGTNLGNSILFQTGGNVGVATNTPGARLDTVGPAIAVRGTSSGTAGTGLFGKATSTTGVNFGVEGIDGSPNGAGVIGTNSAANGVAVVGKATATGVNANIGVQGVSSGSQSTGVSGIGSQYGVTGVANNGVSGTAGVYGHATAATGPVSGVLGNTASSTTNAAGVFGTETAASGQVYGVSGNTSSTGPNAAAVNGFESATSGQVFGVAGSTNSTTNYAAGVSGFEGATTGIVFGVQGGTNSTTQGAAAVNGFEGATTGQVSGVSGGTNSTTQGAAGVNGFEGATTGQVHGVNGSTNSTTNFAAGVSGFEGATTGTVFGVQGGTNSTTQGAAAVNGFEGATTGQVYGVAGSTNSTTNFATGVSGFEGATTGTVFGVQGGTNSTTQGAAGVNGFESATTGQVYGVNGSTNTTTNFAAGVSGFEGATTGTVFGVTGTTNSATSGSSGLNGFEGAKTGGPVYGVSGYTASTGGIGVFGSAQATSGFAVGLEGATSSPGGTAGQFVNLSGSGLVLVGQSGSKFNTVFSLDASGNGSFAGNLNVTGRLTKGSGSFKIDDPLDPAHKYLSHSFVESPDMMNVYNGNITTDKHGLATVVLPDYFEALNRDFRYQLTVIGQFAQAIVHQEIQHNRFTIKTSKPSVKVSWQVTGIRHDAYADAYRIPVQEEKPPLEQGHYLHPELFGAAEHQAIGAAASEPSTGSVPPKSAVMMNLLPEAGNPAK